MPAEVLPARPHPFELLSHISSGEVKCRREGLSEEQAHPRRRRERNPAHRGADPRALGTPQPCVHGRRHRPSDWSNPERNRDLLQGQNESMGRR